MSAVARILDVPGLAPYLGRVEQRLEATVATGGGPVADAGRETLASGGKRLRPMLVYLCAPADGRSAPAVVTAGAAVELIHMATLVHDDQLDAAPLRRGRPTVWHARGATVATATGDHLFARAFAELAADGDMEAVTVLSDACLDLARGEIRQREQAGDPATTPEQYLERCRLKTGRLFAAAAWLGARAGGLGANDAAALADFAEALGLAFQIADDVLDCDGDPDTTGKALGTDLLDGTITLPLLLAAARDPDVAAVIRRGAAPADVLPTLARVAGTGALADARAEAARHASLALDARSAAPPPTAARSPVGARQRAESSQAETAAGERRRTTRRWESSGRASRGGSSRRCDTCLRTAHTKRLSQPQNAPLHDSVLPFQSSSLRRIRPEVRRRRRRRHTCRGRSSQTTVSARSSTSVPSLRR
jgi:geranylgeranyl pyrophosphate synthase